MLPGSISYLILSDIHLGHNVNPAGRIIDNLKKLLNKYETIHLDIIFIAGDLFDKLVDNTMSENKDIQLWIFWLLCYCERKKTRLRVLEGTRSHDRGQSGQFETIYKISRTSIDYKYIPYLYIEYMSDLDIHILYVPDEWHENTSVTYKQALELMKKQNIEKVDLAIMHGQFHYQLRTNIQSIPKHREEDYLSIVRYYIHIGHVHTYSQFNRIVAQGSFDRLAHGEEEPKGMVYAIIRKDGSFEHHFIENKEAMVFKTIKVTEESLEKLLIYLDKRINKLPINSSVRLVAKKDSLAYKIFSDLEARYGLYRLTKKTTEQTNTESYISYIDNTEYQVFSITRENIAGLIRDEVVKSATMTQSHIDRMEEILTEECQ